MKKNLTELVFVVDRSGSMGGLETDTIGGFNATLARHRKADRTTERLGEGEVEIGQMLPLLPVERLDERGIVLEEGRSLVGGYQRAPMLVLPPLRVVEAHGVHRLAGAVGVRHLRRELDHAIGRHDTGAVALRAFDVVLPEVDHRITAQHSCEVADRREVCSR